MDLAYEFHPPVSRSGVTFVGCNALTSELGLWESQLGDGLRDAGHGTLWWNLRGQAGSAAPAGMVLDDRQHAADLLDLLDAVQPPHPVLMGLSIGGLFAAQALLEARDATPAIAGLVLLNTLRKPGPRLDWINDAVFSAVRFGGTALVGDLFSPMLFHDDWLAANRADALKGEYAPTKPDAGVYRLLDDARRSNWDIPWEQIHPPVLVATGLADRVFRVDADIEELTTRLPRPTSVIIPDAGHMLPLEAPADLRRHLLDWVAQMPDPNLPLDL